MVSTARTSASRSRRVIPGDKRSTADGGLQRSFTRESFGAGARSYTAECYGGGWSEVDAEAQHARAFGVKHEQLATRADRNVDAGGAAGTQAPAEVVAEFVPPIERPDVDAAAGFVRGKDVFLGYCDAAQRADLRRQRLG